MLHRFIKFFLKVEDILSQVSESVFKLIGLILGNGVSNYKRNATKIGKYATNALIMRGIWEEFFHILNIISYDVNVEGEVPPFVLTPTKTCI